MITIERVKNIVRQHDIHKIITTIFAQGLLSITNFAVGIVIAKYAVKTEYGLYVFLFSFIGILSGYHNALISDPLMVLVNHKKEGERQVYVASLSVARNYLFIPLLLLFSFFLCGYYIFVLGQYQYIVVSIFMSLVIMMYNSKEFLRTVHFTLLNTNTIFIMDLLMFATVFVGTFLVIYNDIVSSFSGFVVLCLGYTSSYIYGKSRNPYKKIKNINIKEAIKENWAYSKWLFIGIHSSLLINRTYIYVITALLGLEALADVSASRLFLVPMILLYGSIGKIMVAKGSIMVANNEHKKFKNFIIYILLTLLCIWFVYFAAIILLSNKFIGFLGGKYGNIKDLILLWGFCVLIATIKSALGTSIIVYKRFKEQAIYDLYGAVSVLISCVFFVILMGKAGGILSYMLGELVMMVLYLKLYLRLGQEFKHVFSPIESVGRQH